VKYLGIILDANLIWWEHARQRIIEDFPSFKLCLRTLVKIWDLRLKTVQWIYTGVTRPVLIIRAFFGGETLVWQWSDRLQRHACVLLDLWAWHPMAPLDTLARVSACMFSCTGIWYGKKSDIGHTQIHTHLEEEDSVYQLGQDKWNQGLFLRLTSRWRSHYMNIGYLFVPWFFSPEGWSGI
jgi:hypothetical protein